MSTVVDLPSLGDSSWMDWATDVHDNMSAAGRVGVITVASNEATTEQKKLCDYVCDGTDDQTEINAALALASRVGDALGGAGHGRVLLVGPNFYIGNNGTTSITMYPNTWLQGNGRATVLRPMWPSNLDRGTIELLNVDTAHTRVSDLTIGRTNAATCNGHGIYYINNGQGDQYEIMTANDSFHVIYNVHVAFVLGRGFWLAGSSGGCRGSMIRDCLAWNAGLDGFFLDGSSDCQIYDSTATTKTNGHGFRIGGGNSQVQGCKSYYTEGTASDGFMIESSRCQITNCSAQDNARHGFNFTSGDVVATGLIADSNSRLVGTGAGFNIAASGIYTGLNALDRAQTPSSPQLTQIAFSGSPQVLVEGRTSLGANGTVHVSGAPGSNSYVRIVRQGTTLHSVG